MGKMNRHHSSSCSSCHAGAAHDSDKESLALTLDHDHRPHAGDHDALAPEGAPRRIVVDYVVVGAGTAGAPLAKLLSDDPNVSVFVIEGGSNTQKDPVILDPNGGPTSVELNRLTSRYHWLYGADPALAAASVPALGIDNNIYTMGRMWGGSSGHNFLLNVRGTPGLYNEWGQVDPQWSYDSLLPAMKYLETYTPLATGVFNPAERGSDGPLFVTQVPAAGFAAGGGGIAPTSGIIVAFTSVGVVYSPDYNDPSRGVYVAGDYQNYVVPPPNLQRSWAASAFLNEGIVTTDANGDGIGVGNRDLFVDSDGVALRLLFADDLTDEDRQAIAAEFGFPRLTGGIGCGRCRSGKCGACLDREATTVVGVRYLADGVQTDVLARTKVISCLGSVADPAFLQQSGIGPADVLEPLDIPVRVDNANVGRKGQNHYGPLVILPANPADGQFSFTAFLPSTDSAGAEGPRGFQALVSVNLPFLPFPAAIVTAALLRPARLSEVDTERRDPTAPPYITFNLYKTEEDKAEIVAFLRTIRDVSIAYTGQEPISPDPSVYAGGDEALLAYAQANTIVFNHLCGTCRMAESAADGVVDGDLDVFGVDGLGVASNSIAPSIADGNTAWSAYIIGLTKAKIEGAPVPF